jgi:zinc transporter ZupT
MPLWAQSGFWGFVAGSALLLGAALGFYVKVKQKVIAWVMAFGGGVLISAVAFDLMDEAFKRGGFDSTSVGFLAGALAYTAANYALSRYGAKHRKRSGKQQPSEAEESGSGLAIAVGALLDGIPESMAIGIGLLHGGAVSWVMVAAIFLSNALSCLRELKLDEPEAAAAFIPLLRDTDRNIRFYAAEALCDFPEDAQKAGVFDLFPGLGAFQPEASSPH